MDLSRANGNFQASALSSLNGESSNTTGNNNESVPSLIGAESVLPSREAFARPRRLPTTETAQILSPGMIPPTAMSLREGTTSARTSASSRIPTPIGTSYITGRQLHWQWQPRQVYQERTTPGSYGAQDPNVNSSGMPIQPSLRSEISDQITPPPPPASVPRRAMPMHRPPIRSSGVTERDQVRHDTPSGHATTTTSSLLDWNSPMSIPVSPMSRPERSDHEQRHRLFQQRLNDEAQQFDARREPPLSGEFVARPSCPPWITANPLPPATVPSAPNMHPAIRPGVIVVPGTFPVVPFHMHTNAMRGATQTSENHPWISSANRTASQPADAGSTFWEHLVGPLPGTPISDTSVAAVSLNPLSARPNVVASNPPVSGTSNVYLTISNTQLHYEEASDPDNIPTTINEPGTIRNTNSRREMGTQSALSIPGTTSSDSTNILRSPLGDVARSAPARALFLFELISAFLDATSSLTSAASTSSSNSSLNQIGEQPSAGAMTSSPRSSSVAGFFAQYLTAAIAASHIANVEQEHYAGHGSGNLLTTLGGGGAHLNRGQDHVVVTRSRSRRRDGLSSAVLGYRVGDGPHSTSELGTYREANDGSSPNEPQTRGRFAGSWGNRLNRDGDGDGDDWDLEDDDDLRLFYASHATPESLIDDYEENWGSWGGADRSGPPSESHFPSFGPARQQVIENGRGEESQNDDHHHHYLYRYQDTTRPLLSRRNRVRGGLLPGSLLRSPGVNERDTSGRALPLLPLHSPFSDGSVPRRSTIEILDANGILIDAHIPSNPSHSDLYGDGPESPLGLFRYVHPLTRGGLTMSAPLRSEGGLSLGDDRIERRGRQRNHVAGPHTEGSIFHTGVERRHPAKCFESECINTSESPCFPFDVACEGQAAAVPLFYRLSHFENSQGRAVRRETRVTAQYYTYWHPNTV